MPNVKRIEDVIPDESKSATIQLHYPVQLADRVVQELSMRRPTMGDLLYYEPKSIEDITAEVALLGRLCGLKKEEMRLLDATDYARLQNQYLRFRAVSGA